MNYLITTHFHSGSLSWRLTQLHSAKRHLKVKYHRETPLKSQPTRMKPANRLLTRFKSRKNYSNVSEDALKCSRASKLSQKWKRQLLLLTRKVKRRRWREPQARKVLEQTQHKRQRSEVALQLQESTRTNRHYLIVTVCFLLRIGNGLSL